MTNLAFYANTSKFPSSYTVKLSGKDKITRNFTISYGSKYRFGPLTFREAWSVRSQLCKAIGQNHFYNDAIYNKFRKIAPKLYEKDAKYKKEYHSSSTIYQGFDYLNVSVYQPSDPGVIINYRDIMEPTKTIIDSKIYSLNKKQTYSATGTLIGKNGAQYVYTGSLQEIKPTKKKKVIADSITLKKDGKAHEITFWYKRSPEQGLVVNVYHINEKTDEILKTEPNNIVTKEKSYIAKKTNFKKLEYSGGYSYSTTLTKAKAKEKYTEGNSFEINDSQFNNTDTIYVVFWYQPEDNTARQVTVKHLETNTDKLLLEETLEFKKDIEVDSKEAEISKKWNIPYESIPGKTKLDNKNYKKLPVEIKYDKQNHTVIIYYKKTEKPIEPIPEPTPIEPQLIFGNPDDPHGPNPAYPDGYDYAKMRAELGARMEVSDLRNQYMGTKNGKYWVLDEKGTITLYFAYTTQIGDEVLKNITIKSSIEGLPTEITEDGDFASSAWTKDGTVTMNIQGTNVTYQKAHVTFEKVIPIWIQEELGKTITGKIEFNCNRLTTPRIGKEKETLSIVGAIYDFSVTNIDRGDRTGDTMWGAKLFGSYKEYEADSLPIGQSVQQPAKYPYGIKKGTRFYFTINTKGMKSKSLTIVPKFVHYQADGTNPQEVELYRKDGNKYVTERKVSLASDANRKVGDYALDAQAAIGKNISLVAAQVSIGTYQTISLGDSFRMPYAKYVLPSNTDKAKYHENTVSNATHNSSNILDNVSHWYGDFVLPMDAIIKRKANGTDVSHTGYVVVYFTIQANDASGKGYLAYGKESPFKQEDVAVSEWNYERKFADNNKGIVYTLPVVGTSVNGWQEAMNIGNATYVPVIIYDVSQSTLVNIDAVGTH